MNRWASVSHAVPRLGQADSAGDDKRQPRVGQLQLGGMGGSIASDRSSRPGLPPSTAARRNPLQRVARVDLRLRRRSTNRPGGERGARPGRAPLDLQPGQPRGSTGSNGSADWKRSSDAVSMAAAAPQRAIAVEASAIALEAERRRACLTALSRDSRDRPGSQPRRQAAQSASAACLRARRRETEPTQIGQRDVTARLCFFMSRV